MVRQGRALAYRQYGTDYVSAEEQAQKDRIGMWAGSFTPPWEWRHVERQKASDTPARADCRIKGNNNSRSEEHKSELQSIMCISNAGFCLKIKEKELR